MDTNSIIYLLEQLGVRHAQARGDEVICQCPFAPWRHAGGHDNDPSFAVHVDSVRGSVYNCLACSAKGNMNNLVWEMSQHTHVDWKRLKEFIGRSESTGLSNSMESVGSYSDRYRKHDPLVSGDAWATPPAEREREKPVYDGKSLAGRNPHEVYESSKGNEPTRFLRERGIDVDILNYIKIGYDKQDNVIVLPIFNMNNDLMGCGYRQLGDKKPKYIYSRGCPISELFFFEDKFWNSPKPDKRLIVVEGFFDVLKLWGWGYNAISLLGSQMGDAKVEKLLRMVRRAGASYDVYMMLDGDKGGQDSEQKIIHGDGSRGVKGLKDRISVYQCGLKGNKDFPNYDPGDFIVKEEVERAIAGAALYGQQPQIEE